jgi:hypothetical protein
MRKIIPLCIVPFALLGLAACGDDNSESKQTLTLDSKGGRTITVEDNGRRGPTAGDERTFSQTLTQDGKVVGRLDGSTTITATGGGKEQRIGSVQYTIAGGTIVASGVYLSAPGVFLPVGGVTRPIVGGTGKYKGARGQVTQTPVGGEIRSVLEFTLPSD